MVRPLEEWGIDGPRAEVLASRIIDYEYTEQERASLMAAFITRERLAAALVIVFAHHYAEYYGEDPNEDATAILEALG